MTAEARHIAKIARSVETDLDDPTRVVVADTPSHRADAGMAWGTLIHGLLEHAMRHKTATRDDLRRLAMWLTVEEPQLRPVIDDALDTILTVAAAPFWKEARTTAEGHEEVPFAVRADAEAIPRVLNGTIDLVYRAAEGWRLIDYKTDADTSDADLAKRYRDQITAYEKAWGRFSDGNVSSSLVGTRVK